MIALNQFEQKDWTILIYANGNNELQPEIWRVKTDAERIGSSENVNVVMQISREKNELISILRPYESLPQVGVKWIGARRYFVTKDKSNLIMDLGRINMANPMTLYDFIKWGISCYPAKHYLLILGGHGYQFVGAMTDYSQSVPYIMGIPGLCEAIQLASCELGRKIDLLVLDVCYFNMIESVYEFGKDENHAVQSIITYIGGGPLQGLSYDKLIRAVQCNSYLADLPSLIRRIVDSLDFDLVAVEINHNKLKYIKKLYCDLADCYLASKGDKTAKLHELFLLKPEDEWYTLASSINYAVLSLILCHKSITDSKSALLNCATLPTDNLEKIIRYSKLSFAQDNNWTYLLSNKAIQPCLSVTSEVELSSLVLSAQEVFNYICIMNPSLSKEGIQVIFEKLLQYKKWVLIE